MNGASREGDARALEGLGLKVVGFEAVLVMRAHRRKASCWNLNTDITPSLLFHRQRLDWARFAVERMTTFWHKTLVWLVLILYGFYLLGN